MKQQIMKPLTLSDIYAQAQGGSQQIRLQHALDAPV